MRRIDRVRTLCLQKSQTLTAANLVEKTDIGFTAAALAGELGLLRNNVSADLNELVKTGQVLKITGKPTRFIAKSTLCRLLNVRFIDQRECSSLSELTDQLPPTSKRSVFDDLIGAKHALAPVIRLAEAAITYPPHGLHTMIFGDSGTGKSLLAEKMFQYGLSEQIFTPPAKFVVLNCADYANNPQLLLSQLFGSVKGAYTGADSDRTGLIAAANNGILFLDEVHRLPPEGQEMLFHYIDKGQYYRLGDTKHPLSAHTQLVAATTESPNSALLTTFRRRIPVSIQIPNLAERSFAEHLDLIKYLYEHEAHRIDCPVTVSAEAIRALLGYFPEGNVGQIKSDIQLSIARGLLEKKRNRQSYVTVTKDYFSPQVLKSLLTITAQQKQEISVLAGHADLNFGEARTLNTPQPFDYDFLNFFEHHRQLEPSIDKIFSDYTQEIAKQSIQNKNFSFFLNDDVKQIVLTISDILYDDLGIIIDKDINIALSLYIYSHSKEKLPQLPLSSATDELSPRIIKTVRKIIRQLEQSHHLYFNDSDVSFFAHIISSFQANAPHTTTAVFVCAHGDSVASDLCRTVNTLLGGQTSHPIDMGLDISPADIYQVLKQTINACPETNIILFVDMGSLSSLEANLAADTHKHLFIIESIDPLMILETVQNVTNLSMDLNTCIERIQQINQQKYTTLTRKVENFFDLSKRKIIYTVCTTAEGSAQFLKANLKSVLRNLKVFDIDVKAIRGNTARTVVEKMKAQRDVQIIAIVGTIDPKIASIPFISLQEVVLQNGIGKLLNYAGIQQTPSTEQNMITFNRNVTIAMGIESIDKYLYLLSAQKMEKGLNQFTERLEHSFKHTFNNETILKLIVHTACLIERILLNNNVIQLPDKTATRLKDAHHIKAAFAEIELEYNIQIPLDECYFILDIIMPQ